MRSDQQQADQNLQHRLSNGTIHSLGWLSSSEYGIADDTIGM